MKKTTIAAFLCLFPVIVSAGDFEEIPAGWKWVSENDVVFTYDGTYTDSSAFSFNARTRKKTFGAKAPEKYSDFPVKPVGAVNLTYSPDSTMLAYTKDNDLYVTEIATGKEKRLTFDGSPLVLNGYASWVYYEEIFGRSSAYRAFWWSPDSRKIGFYRFDNTGVPLFPIYSPFGQDGKLSETRYPKAGESNPEVRIGIIDLDRADGTVWADFDPSEDQYFGTPFWGPDSEGFFVSRMPRLQNTLDLYRVDAATGSKSHIYHEVCDTWIDWMDKVIFTDRGLYMARRFETGWEQIYFLSYDGQEFRRLTGGPNWSVSLVRVDERKGDVYFTAKRDATVRQALYRADAGGRITPLTDPAYDVQSVSFSPDGKYFAAAYSNVRTPVKIAVFHVSGKNAPSEGFVVADMAGPDFNASDYALGELTSITTRDGFELPGMIVYPKDFDPSKKYPVHVDLYGGPDTPAVRDRWVKPTEANQWWSDKGIIQITVDCRAAGHNGRKGMDMIYRQLTIFETEDFIEWADYLQSLPYVKADKIGVEGFSFGGTMAAMLVMKAPDKFHYGIAGGGVYDWALYDSHYTERYMDEPVNNPEGYRISRTLEYVSGYPAAANDSTEVSGVEPVMLKLTHGTGDDNVHFQNTLQLVDALQKEGKKFELMIYPDGMHGYRGYQGEHFDRANREFWLKYLKSE